MGRLDWGGGMSLDAGNSHSAAQASSGEDARCLARSRGGYYRVGTAGKKKELGRKKYRRAEEAG